jgi:hypothetical protein
MRNINTFFAIVIIGAPCPDNIMMWNAVIFGPGKLQKKEENVVTMIT